jgi:ribosomal protein S27AE
MEPILCPGCGNLMIFCENDGWWYCESCEYVEEELEFCPF